MCFRALWNRPTLGPGPVACSRRSAFLRDAGIPALSRNCNRNRKVLAMPHFDGTSPLTLKELPESVDAELAAAAWEGGAPWQPEDADGRTLFDTPQSEDGTVLAIFPQQCFAKWRAHGLAHIVSREGR